MVNVKNTLCVIVPEEKKNKVFRVISIYCVLDFILTRFSEHMHRGNLLSIYGNPWMWGAGMWMGSPPMSGSLSPCLWPQVTRIACHLDMSTLTAGAWIWVVYARLSFSTLHQVLILRYKANTSNCLAGTRRWPNIAIMLAQCFHAGL